MLPKAAAADFSGRFREIIADPLNLLIRRVPTAGRLLDGCVVLHNGHRVPVAGEGAYYGDFSQILILNRGVHEPLEEYAFQQMLPHLPAAPRMLELGAYWGHYAMWCCQARPAAQVVLVEPEAANLAAGQVNFRCNGHQGRFIRGFVDRGSFGVDAFLAETGWDRLEVLHSDVQGHEIAMLEDAGQALAAGRVDYLFLSTHGQDLHARARQILAGHGYRIEADADFAAQTTSHDGFVLAVHPDRPAVLPGPAALMRAEIAQATPDSVLARLQAILAAAPAITR